MTRIARTWWGVRFIEALETFCDPSRLSRGQGYASERIKSFELTGGRVIARVRGSVNPYFGVYKEPTYRTEVALAPIAAGTWPRIIHDLTTQASFVARLLLDEVPDTIEASFQAFGQDLLPYTRHDFQTQCSCPDYATPCKHVAGVCYRLAAELDRDPLLLFELRGLSRADLRAQLERSPLGRAFLAATPEPPPLQPDSYYTRPTTVPSGTPSLRAFWSGEQGPAAAPSQAIPPGVAGILIKKQGDYPLFWSKDQSFLAVMEELYERVRTKNREVL